jgi:hypothetical protein
MKLFPIHSFQSATDKNSIPPPKNIKPTTNMKMKTAWAVFFSAAITMLPLWSADSSQYIPGFYTEWEVSPESGDIGGIEIFVFNSTHGPYVVYTLAEGEPGLPVLVKAQLEGDTISFKVDDRAYTGKFTPEGLIFEEGDFKRILKKGSLMN